MNLVVKNMIKKYGYEGIRFTLIVDEGFEKIVPAFEEEAPLVSVKRLSEWGADIPDRCSYSSIQCGYGR